MRFLSVFIFKIIGWKVVGTFPADLNKYIVAVAPHTSNWDFVIGILARSVTRLTESKFLGKSALFKPPYGWFFRWLGGYPVDRTTHHDMVKQVAGYFHAHDHFIVAIAPEGTRKKVEKMKTGFYYIAKEVGVPIVPVGIDFSKKSVIIDQPFYPTGAVEEDMNHLLAFYRSLKGRNPELGL